MSQMSVQQVKQLHVVSRLNRKRREDNARRMHVFVVGWTHFSLLCSLAANSIYGVSIYRGFFQGDCSSFFSTNCSMRLNDFVVCVQLSFVYLVLMMLECRVKLVMVGTFQHQFD